MWPPPPRVGERSCTSSFSEKKVYGECGLPRAADLWGEMIEAVVGKIKSRIFLPYGGWIFYDS